MAKEDKWIEVLSGKRTPNPKNKDEIEASYLREAIGSYEKKIGLNNPNPEFSFYRFEQLLKEKDQHKASTGFINKLKHYKWETLRLIAATATGIAIATLPTVQMATKGAPDSKHNSDGETVVQQIVDNPEVYILELEKKLNNTSSTYKVSKEGKHYFISIQLTPESIKILQAKRVEIDTTQKIITLEISNTK
jgi:hypothetical protein